MLIEDYLNKNASDESGSDEDEECSKELFKSRSYSKMTRIILHRCCCELLRWILKIMKVNYYTLNSISKYMKINTINQF